MVWGLVAVSPAVVPAASPAGEHSSSLHQAVVAVFLTLARSFPSFSQWGVSATTTMMMMLLVGLEVFSALLVNHVRPLVRLLKKPKKPEPTVHNISATLEELYTGTTKKLKITRKRGGRDETKVIEIEVKPGWKAGTKLTFENDGDQDPQTGLCADIVFIIQEKPHHQFKRVGNDLILQVPVTLTEALTGVKRQVTHLDGTKVDIDTKGTVISPENNKKIHLGQRFYRKKWPW